MDAIRMSVLAMAAGLGSSVHAQPVLRDLGTLGGAVSYGNAISADGSVVVGSSAILRDAHTHAFRWTLARGMEDLGTLMADQNSYGSSVSGDGRVVGGFAPAEGSNVHAVRWSAGSAGGSMLDCGTLGGKDSLALAMSADGSMVAGFAALPTASRGHACLWYFGATGQRILDLGSLGGQESKCYGMSTDGSVLAGVTDIPGSNSTRAFRWTLADGMHELGTLGGASSRAFAISAGGGAIVGYSDVVTSGGPGSGSSGGRAFRWTAAQGMQNLGTIGGVASAAYAVSADGRVVAGYDTVPMMGTSHAFIWSEAHGMVDLNVLLPSLGCNTAGWTLIGVNGMSADGTTVTGNGTHNGVMRGFVISGLPLGGGSCRADYDGSGLLAVPDIFAFLNSWFAGEARADFDGSGTITQQDVHAFVNIWFAGCS